MADQSWQVYWFAGGVVYVIAMGCLGGYVATQKGRPEIEGVILSVLFGPPGAIVAACLPTIAKPAAAAADADDEDQVVPEQLAKMAAPPMLSRAPVRPSVTPPRPRRLLGEVEERP